MNGTGDEDFWYPSVDDVLTIHRDIVAEDEDAEPGVADPDRDEFALEYVQHGHFGESPETIHEKAFHLMRLVASNHWFVDGNKRTALNTVELFYLVNGYELDYGENVRSMLKLFSVREDLIDREVGPDYFGDQTTAIDVDETDAWTALGAVVVIALLNHLDADPEEFLPDDSEPVSVRETWALTTPDEDGTTNNEDSEDSHHHGG